MRHVLCAIVLPNLIELVSLWKVIMRRISATNNETSCNLLFAKHETDFWDAFIDNNVLTAEDLNDYYVSSRRAAVSEVQIEELLVRLPIEFSELYAATIKARNNPEIDLDYRIGYYELDLIDFLFNISANRVLCVIGTVGIGKTTFLTYIFQSLRKQMSALQRYVPITISFMQYPGEVLSDDDLFSSIVLQAINCLEAEISWEGNDERLREGIRSHLAKLKEFSKIEHRSQLVELIDFIKRELVFDIENREYVFIIDNVDHLDNSSISKVSVFARALFLESRLAIVLGVRPPSFSSHVATDAHRGAFNSFRIHLAPLDLGAYFTRRIKLVFPDELISLPVDNDSTVITVPVKSAVRNIVKNVLNSENSKLILEGVSNNSIRKASRAFLNIARYEHFEPRVLFSTVDSDSVRSSRSSRMTDTLIDGLMHGEFKYYRDDVVHPVVSNLYVFDHPEYEPDYLIQYRILSVLDWAVKSIDFDVLLNWLMAYGYEQRQVTFCLHQMLARGLVFSPESDHDISLVRYISYSPSGQYYLRELISSKQYLWNAIYDVPLEHSAFHSKDDSHFFGKMSSICEFLEKLHMFETKQVELSRNTKYVPRLLGSISKNGLLQRRVLSAARKILVGAKHSRKESVRKNATIFDMKLSKVEECISSLEKKITTILFEERLSDISPIVNMNICTKKWGQDHSVTLWIPQLIEPARQNTIAIECDIGHNAKTVSLVGRLQGLGQNKYVDEIAELRRKPELPDKFVGSFRVEGALPNTNLSSVRLSLFAESRPILRSVLDTSGTSYD